MRVMEIHSHYRTWNNNILLSNLNLHTTLYIFAEVFNMYKILHKYTVCYEIS